MVAGFADLAGLCAVCRLQDTEVLNAYVLGSSGINGGYSAESDVDVVVVLRDDANRKWKNQNWLIKHGWMPKFKFKRGTFKRDYSGSDSHDVWMYSENTFRTLIQHGVPFALECICLPKTAIWRENLEFEMTCSPQSIAASFSIVSLMHLRRAGMEFATHEGNHFGKGPLVIETWNLYKSKKTLFFSLRFLEMARQLLEHKKIVNRDSMQVWKQSLLNVEGESWTSHMEVFQPLHQQRIKELHEQAGDNFVSIACAPELQYFGNPQYWCACEACVG